MVAYFDKLALAYSKGELFCTISKKLGRRWDEMYIGMKYFSNPSEKITLHCPAYVNPPKEGDERILVKRIFDSYKLMKADQKKKGRNYLPSSLWENELNLVYCPIIEGAKNNDIERFHFFLRNFGTWKQNTGIESNDFLHSKNKRYFGRKHVTNGIFARQLQLWRWVHNNRRPLEVLSYPQYGNQAGAFIDGVFVGVGSFINEYYGSILQNILEGTSHPIIAELGAGYGRFPYFILREFSKFTYLDFDLPETLCLCAYFLMKTWPQKKTLLYGEGVFNHESMQQFDLIFMPSFEIERLASDSVDLFVNKNSLGEMTREATTNYIHHICRATKSYFFHMNHEKKVNIYTDGKRALLGFEYPVSKEKFKMLFRYPEIGHILYHGNTNMDMDIFLYLYQRK